MPATGAALAATGTALVAALAGATPAGAAPEPARTPAGTAAPSARTPETSIDFAAAPDETTVGAPVVLSGRAGLVGRGTGNAGTVRFWFRKGQQGPKVYLGSVAAGDSGAFRHTVKATATGEYLAEYRNSRQPILASGTDFLAVYTNRPVDRMLYTWTATRLSCLPSCRATGPEQFISPGPVQVKLNRDCLQPKSGGRIGFTSDPANTVTPGDPAWREFPDGEGPTTFELRPGVTKGHFHLEWTSGPAPAGQLTACDISFTASQRSVSKDYV
ncbi:hypothetical protein GCM10025331_69040 [Actinoplanes utahensis]|uniref:Uncharacterized protein n=1 Tax=Actinoplanes utahensis TaxID=1869 RepID=A0A0A6UK43_ACTUT|nr:hypothetical protein MB27_27215 [Actinoplanes utahensis]GIF34434.1 hypothetical protein Aut01nite_74200 [Actinoplanes utahensis]